MTLSIKGTTTSSVVTPASEPTLSLGAAQALNKSLGATRVVSPGMLVTQARPSSPSPGQPIVMAPPVITVSPVAQRLDVPSITAKNAAAFKALDNARLPSSPPAHVNLIGGASVPGVGSPGSPANTATNSAAVAQMQESAAYDGTAVGGALPGEQQAQNAASDDYSYSAAGPDASGTAEAPMTMSTATGAAPKASWWHRLLVWLGLVHDNTATVSGEGDSLDSMAAAVVRRARNGDQNAMALIQLTRQNALKGSPRAAQALKAIQGYITSAPVTATVHGEGDASFAHAVRLSHGPRIGKARMGAMMAGFGSEERSAFKHGVAFGRDSKLQGSFSQRALAANAAGKLVGEARKLQLSRVSTVPFAHIDPKLAHELD